MSSIQQPACQNLFSWLNACWMLKREDSISTGRRVRKCQNKYSNETTNKQYVDFKLLGIDESMDEMSMMNSWPSCSSVESVRVCHVCVHTHTLGSRSELRVTSYCTMVRECTHCVQYWLLRSTCTYTRHHHACISKFEQSSWFEWPDRDDRLIAIHHAHAAWLMRGHIHALAHRWLSSPTPIRNLAI